MTATDAFDAFVKAFPWPVLLHGIEHVLAAGGLEATVAAHEVSEGGTVHGNHEINQPNSNGIDDPHACMIHQPCDHRLCFVQSDKTYVCEIVTLIKGCAVSALRRNAAIVYLVIDRCCECVACVVFDVYRIK